MKRPKIVTAIFLIALVAVLCLVPVLMIYRKGAIAREVLGNDFISPEEIAEKYRETDAMYSVSQRFKLGLSVPPRRILEWCRDHGYMILPGPGTPLSLLEVRGLNINYFYYPDLSWRIDLWYIEERFAREEKIGPTWLLIRKTPVQKSKNLSWEEQHKLLLVPERVPRAVEVAWAMAAHRTIRGTNLPFGDMSVRTGSVASDNRRVVMGYAGGTTTAVFGAYSQGILPLRIKDDEREDFVGIAVAR